MIWVIWSCKVLGKPLLDHVGYVAWHCHNILYVAWTGVWRLQFFRFCHYVSLYSCPQGNTPKSHCLCHPQPPLLNKSAFFSPIHFKVSASHCSNNIIYYWENVLFSFSVWNDYEPNNWRGLEWCSELWGHGLNDKSCSAVQAYICERSRGKLSFRSSLSWSCALEIFAASFRC